MKRPQQLDAIHLERHLLYYSGFYPKNRNILFYISRYVTLLFSSIMMLTMIIRMIVDMPDLMKVLETLHMSTTQLAFLGKGIPFIMRDETILEVERHLMLPVFNAHSEKQDVYIAWAIKKNMVLTRVYLGLVIVATSFYLIYPLIVNHSTISLMMTGLISIMCAQLNVLKDTLENITDVSDAANQSVDDVESIVTKRIYNCAIHHEAILRVIDNIESIFSIGTCFQFFAGIVTICLTGVMMLWIDFRSMQFFTLAFYGIAITNQFALSCWFGHDIMTRSEGIIHACYMNTWYEYSSSVRQALFIIMERSKKPIRLTAGYIWTLNLSTFVTILRTAYSYFAVIRQVNSRE